MARSIYRLNDRRAAIKRAISLAGGSTLVEEKVFGEPQ
jgi:protein involved in polysaccharide export with SLBB domain